MATISLEVPARELLSGDKVARIGNIQTDYTLTQVVVSDDTVELVGKDSFGAEPGVLFRDLRGSALCIVHRQTKDPEATYVGSMKDIRSAVHAHWNMSGNPMRRARLNTELDKVLAAERDRIRRETIDWLAARKFPYDVSSIAIDHAREHIGDED